MKAKNYVYRLTENNALLDWAYHFLHKCKIHSRRHLQNEEYAQKCYYENTGRKLDLENPKTFDEKLWWLKFHYRNPLMTQCVDKYKVREYVKECGLGDILNELYGVYSNSSEIDYKKLPDKFYIKTNHGCGCNFLCADKTKFPFKKVSGQLDANLKQNYFYESREWPYRDVEPRIIVEKVLEPRGGYHRLSLSML